MLSIAEIPVSRSSFQTFQRDHYVLIDELSLLGVDPVPSDWMKSFLTNTTAQAVCIDNTLSEWKNTYGGILQGTKMTL